MTGPDRHRFAMYWAAGCGGCDISVLNLHEDISFDPATAAIARRPDGKPDCSVNTDLVKGGYFAFQPPGCTTGTCTAVRAIVLGVIDDGGGPRFGNVKQIVKARTIQHLYGCNVSITSTHAGVFNFYCNGAMAADPRGIRIRTTCDRGHVRVQRAPTH